MADFETRITELQEKILRDVKGANQPKTVVEAVEAVETDVKTDVGRNRSLFGPLIIHQWRGRRAGRLKADAPIPEADASRVKPSRKTTYEVKGVKNLHGPIVVEAVVELDKGKKDPAVIRRRGKEVIFNFEDTAAAKETMASIRAHKPVEVQPESEKHGFLGFSRL
ncbi:MAG: hypothetical protein ABWY04_01185 [Arthrobacter sp.]